MTQFTFCQQVPGIVESSLTAFANSSNVSNEESFATVFHVTIPVQTNLVFVKFIKPMMGQTLLFMCAHFCNQSRLSQISRANCQLFNFNNLVIQTVIHRQKKIVIQTTQNHSPELSHSRFHAGGMIFPPSSGMHNPGP